MRRVQTAQTVKFMSENGASRPTVFKTGGASIATHIEVKFSAGTPNKKTEWVYVIAIWNSFHTQCGKFLDSQSTVGYIRLFGKIIDVPNS